MDAGGSLRAHSIVRRTRYEKQLQDLMLVRKSRRWFPFLQGSFGSTDWVSRCLRYPRIELILGYLSYNVG